MAYTRFEDIPARVIQNRIVPRLRKYYRADGSFDLFDVWNLQANCLHFLATQNEAGAYTGRPGGGWGDWVTCSYGQYSLDNSGVSTSPSYNYFDIGKADHTLYGAKSETTVILKLNNKAGLYPYYVYLRNYSEHNSGNSYIWVYRKSTSSDVVVAGGENNRDFSWTLPISSASSIYDWKDYEYIRVRSLSTDGSKYTGNWSRVRMGFIHRYPIDHPLYRYYR